MEKRNIVRNQKGFTLIEIIAVLVILGILAAVAVPKFVDLQTEATLKADEAIFGALQSAASLNFAKGALSPSTTVGTTVTPHVPITTSTLLVAVMDGGLPDVWKATGAGFNARDGRTVTITSEVTGTSQAVLNKVGW